MPLTERVTLSDPVIDKLCIAQKRQSKDFEALKFRNVSVGGTVLLRLCRLASLAKAEEQTKGKSPYLLTTPANLVPKKLNPKKAQSIACNESDVD